jgi:hypothetical protein
VHGASTIQESARYLYCITRARYWAPRPAGTSRRAAGPHWPGTPPLPPHGPAGCPRRWRGPRGRRKWANRLPIYVTAGAARASVTSRPGLSHLMDGEQGAEVTYSSSRRLTRRSATHEIVWTRVDAGHSVTGANDPRLGDVHVVLLSHAHASPSVPARGPAAISWYRCQRPQGLPVRRHRLHSEMKAIGRAIMSVPPAYQRPCPNACEPRLWDPARRSRLARTALTRITLVGLITTAACSVVPRDPEPSPPATAVKSTTAASRAGEFSGTYQDGLPVYLFPTIYVIGKRSAD